jgi:hypothetical protein
MIKITSFSIQTVEFIFKRSNFNLNGQITNPCHYQPLVPMTISGADSNTNGTITLTHTGPTARSYVL